MANDGTEPRNEAQTRKTRRGAQKETPHRKASDEDLEIIFSRFGRVVYGGRITPRAHEAPHPAGRSAPTVRIEHSPASGRDVLR